MSKSLRERRCEFSLDLASLLIYADRRGYGAAVHWVYRNEAANESVSGVSNSNHLEGLAADINLYDPAGQWLANTADHEWLGDYWESIRPENRWGGRYGDGNHYERTD